MMGRRTILVTTMARMAPKGSSERFLGIFRRAKEAPRRMRA